MHCPVLVGTWECRNDEAGRLWDSRGLEPRGTFALRKVSLESRLVHEAALCFGLRGLEESTLLKNDRLDHLLTQWKPPLTMLPRDPGARLGYCAK